MKRPIPMHWCDDCAGSGRVELCNYNGPYEAICDECEGRGEFDVDACPECGCRCEVVTADDLCLACDLSMQLTENSEFHHSSRQRELAERIADVINGDWAKPFDPRIAQHRTDAMLAALNLKG